MTRRQALLAVPLGIAGLAGAGFWAMLRGMQAGSFDPRGVPSPITGKLIPAFDLPAQPPGQGFGSSDFTGGKPVMLNFFASWCMPCEEEHAALMALAGVGLPIWAIAYKDKPDAAARFLEQHGNPYQRIASDVAGRVAIDFGVSGVPESFVIDGRGLVRWHYAGPLDGPTIEHGLRPAWQAVA